MNEFLQNTDRYFKDTYEYNGKTYIRECHSVAGTHWHYVSITGSKQFELVTGELEKELEKSYLRSVKLKRVTDNKYIDENNDD